MNIMPTAFDTTHVYYIMWQDFRTSLGRYHTILPRVFLSILSVENRSEKAEQHECRKYSDRIDMVIIIIPH